jgi:DNA-binding NarL/FixJ family response regulator
MRHTRVLLVDDHTAIRQALRMMLESEADMAVVGEAGDGAEGVAVATTLEPDVTIVDLAMPGMGGLAAIPALRKAAPRTAILVFTMHESAAYVHEAMRTGARGYLLKSAHKEELLSAIRALRAGGGYLQPRITGTVLRRLVGDARVAGEAGLLTAREIQILESVADGKSNKEIAAAMSIAEDTVKTHLRRLFEKLGAADRAHAVAIALRQNLID